MSGAAGARRSTAEAPVTGPSLLASAIGGNCPRCGAHTLFDGWARFAKSCRSCGLNFDSFNVGDGPAAFLILIVGGILVPSALLLDAAAEPAWWIHLIWVPVAAALTTGGLRIAKASLLAQEYKHRAREGRIAE